MNKNSSFYECVTEDQNKSTSPIENMEAEVVSTRVHRFLDSVQIEKGTQVIERELSFSINDKVWVINYEISPGKSEVTFKAVPGFSLDEFQIYQIVCSILNHSELGLITFKGDNAKLEFSHQEFFKWSDVKKIQENGSNVVQIRFDVIEISPIDSQINDCAKIKQTRMLSFFETEEYSDFLIKTKKKNFKVHKIVLAARSPVFHAMFRSNMKECKTGVVSIMNVRTEVMEELLRFMYADVTEKLSEMPCELFAAAHLYEVQDLEKLCIEHMSTQICAENVTGILSLCDRYLLDEPKEAALKFVGNNEELMVKREEYLIYLMETVMIENVVERLKLARKYKIANLKNFLLEFMSNNYKDLIKNADYRDMYYDKEWVKIVLEVDEYISNCCGNNKVNNGYVANTENNTNIFVISSIILLLAIIWYTS